jgi:hypothetical protein
MSASIPGSHSHSSPIEVSLSPSSRASARPFRPIYPSVMEIESIRIPSVREVLYRRRSQPSPMRSWHPLVDEYNRHYRQYTIEHEPAYSQHDGDDEDNGVSYRYETIDFVTVRPASPSLYTDHDLAREMAAMDIHGDDYEELPPEIPRFINNFPVNSRFRPIVLPDERLSRYRRYHHQQPDEYESTHVFHPHNCTCHSCNHYRTHRRSPGIGIGVGIGIGIDIDIDIGVGIPVHCTDLSSFLNHGNPR